MKKTILLTIVISLFSTPAFATITEPYPGSIRINGDITCPAQYPVKTGESMAGGTWRTTCYTTQAWSLYLAGGDDWDSWLNGTWTPAPTPTPTVTVTAEPIVTYVDRVIETSSVERIIEPCLINEPKTKKAIKFEIKKLQKELKSLQNKLKKLNVKKDN